MNGDKRVLIGEPHAICRWAIERAIAQNDCALSVVGEATSPDEALAMTAECGPDVALMGFADVENTRAISGIVERFPRSRVVALALHDEGEAGVVDAIAAGAVGYVPRSAGISDVIEALVRVAAGEAAVHPSVAAVGLLWAGQRLRRAHHDERMMAMLTPREREVLMLLSEGMSAKMIARRLHLSRRTVETHLAHGYRKLQVRNQIDAVRVFARLSEVAS